MTFTRKLSPNANAHPADVVGAKLILRGLGHYDAPDWGISEYPDRDLFNAIKDFQSKHGLKADGVINHDGETVQAMAQRIQAMGRNGDIILAHINPAEAELLDRVTDGGSINPLTGLPEFVFFGGFSDLSNSFSHNGTNTGNDTRDSSDDHMNGSEGGGGDGHDSDSENAVESEPSTETEGESTQAESTTSGPSPSQHAEAIAQNSEEEEEEGSLLGGNGFDKSNATQMSSKPNAPKEEFSLSANFMEDLGSLVTGVTKTGEKRGPHSAYDTRAAKAMAKEQAQKEGLTIDWNSPEGKGRINSFQRGGTYGPGSVYYNFNDFHQAQRDQLAHETGLNSTTQNGSNAEGSSGTDDTNRNGAHAATLRAASIAGLKMDELGNLIDEDGNIIGNVYDNSALTLAGGTKYGFASDPNNPGVVYQGLQWTWDMAADIADRLTNPKRNQYNDPRNNTMTDEELEAFLDGALDYAGTKALGGAASIGGVSPVVPEPLRSGLGVAGELISKEADRKKKDLLK